MPCISRSRVPSASRPGATACGAAGRSPHPIIRAPAVYFEEKFGVPHDLVLALQRWFHNAGNGFMVQTDSLERELRTKGFVNIRRWCRGVDTEMFRPVEAQGLLDLPRPVFTYVGRVSAEKNLDDFLGARPAWHQTRRRRRAAARAATASAIRTLSSPAGRRARS